MGSVYKRGPFWWIAFKLPGGQRVMRSSGVASSAPKFEALKVLHQVERELEQETLRTVGTKTTLAEFAIPWTATRKAAKQTNAQRDFDRLALHVFPTLGARRLGTVRPTDVRNLLRDLRAKGLAPRTVINIYSLLRRLFHDAVAEEQVIASPCVLKKGDLPKKRDKDPSWRARALFTREEAEQLLSSPLVPFDRRVTYGLALLTGMREGEIAALRWRSFEQRQAPLGRILVVASFTRHNGFEKETKTGNPREVPAHPTLARILKEWEERGFAELFGREPRPDDLIIPNRHGGYRTDHTFEKIGIDLKALGLRRRRFHDTRRTFISLGRTDGANPAVLKSITHDQVGDVFDQYTTFTFEAKCEAVSRLQLSGRVVSLASRAAAGARNPAATPTATRGGTPMRSAGNSSGSTTPRVGAHSPPTHRPPPPTPRNASSGPAAPRRSPPLQAVQRSNVATRAIESDIEEALTDFRRRGDKSRLAARLRQLLIRVRS